MTDPQIQARNVASSAPLHTLLDKRMAIAPRDLAYRFLPEGEGLEQLLTIEELAVRARSLAAGLLRHGAGGQLVLLMHRPGLAFIEGLFACWYAGSIAVPCYPPRGGKHRRRFESIISDSGAKFVLADAGQPSINGLNILDPDTLIASGEQFAEVVQNHSRPCIIQYTSGSTATPKGVMISQQNIRSHFASLRCYSDLGLHSAVSWLPPYHDMGLILKILYSFEAGIPLTFFSPDHFIQRPVRWLRAISRFRAELSGAPNFAFEMCLRAIRHEELEGLDLSCWKAAPCGAERIRPETLERFTERFAPYGFNPEAFLPGYGLAESTLTVTACSSGPPRLSETETGLQLVSSGFPLPGVDLRIADPSGGHTLPDREIGEIRIRGAVVSSGYWNNPGATLETFCEGGENELCSGDLGYLDGNELFVTGRIKDLIIIDGVNHFPEDIEAVVLASIPEVLAIAAFATTSQGRESIQIAIETERLASEQQASLCQRIRSTIGEQLEVPIARVLIFRSGLLPRTTSGKIRRHACREACSNHSLKPIYDDPSGNALVFKPQAAKAVLMEIISEVTGRAGAMPEDDLIALGMTSMETTRLAAALKERTGASISIGELFSARSLLQISALIPDGMPDDSGFPDVVIGSGSGANILTYSQERMWFLHQLEPQSAAYHIFGALELKGLLDVVALDKAIAKVVSQHDVLCSRHGSEDGKAKVSIMKDVIPRLEVRSCADEAELHQILTEFSRKPFELSSKSPLRVCIVSPKHDRHIFGICIHHIAADGWSLRILAREIAAAYSSIRSGAASTSVSLATSYLDYAVSHRRWIDSGAVNAQIEYWKSKLAGHSGMLELNTDFPRPAEPSSMGGSQEEIIDPALCNRVASIAKAHRATPFMVYLAAYLLLLRRHGASDDPVVAIPVSNRNHAAAVDLIGTLVNTLPFRLPLRPEFTFSDLIERVRTATFEMQAAQEAPFEKIIAAVNPDRSRDHSPLAQVMFDYQEIPIAEIWDGHIECRPFSAYRGSVQFDLSLLLTVMSDRQQLVIEYRTDLFLPETADLMMQRYLETLETACCEPSLTLAELSGLCHSDRMILDQHSHGLVRDDLPMRVTPDLIAMRVENGPSRIAVACGETALDYATLAERSDTLASHLMSQGIKPGDRLAVMIERDLDLPVALLAIWKTGAAYVSLDHSNPVERLKLILNDQRDIRVLVSADLIDYLPSGVSTIVMDDFDLTECLTPFRHRIGPNDTAYVIYTSGSTGIPKGVVISHGALANFLQSMVERPGLTTVDRLMAVTTISFDISILELFLPLISGACVDVISSGTARDGEALLERLTSTQPTVMQATPATWRMLLDSNWQGSRNLKILCGGEALDLALATQLQQMGAELWNLYGPTETTIWSALWKVPENPEFIRIGHPIANTGLHVLMPDRSPAPLGVTGELWISGSGLADGYWNRPDLTKSCFEERETRRYRTGDLGRFHRDGSLECLGRSDSQIKIRGFRVELDEIESALSKHPQVSQAKVDQRGANPCCRKLIAWVTPKDLANPPSSKELRDFLGSLLPSYMLPADIGVIDAFPLGASGKVNITQLRSPQTQIARKQPLTHSEKKLARIWSELLERSDIQMEDDWFHIGGHSLLALRLFSRIHTDFGRTLPLSAILDHSTLGDLASIIDETPSNQELTLK